MATSYARAAASGATSKTGQKSTQAAVKGEKEKDVRLANITAAKAVSDVLRTSLGPRGMDKMIKEGHGEVMITNDGRTILEHIKVSHPAARMLAELSKAQDVAAGDGTTSVVVIAGALLSATQVLMERGIHPTTISDAYQKACAQAITHLRSIAIPVDLSDRESLIKSATTSLSSKVVSADSKLLAPMAVDAVLGLLKGSSSSNVNLSDIRVVKNLGGTVPDSELVDGLVFTQKVSHAAGAPTKIQSAKIALLQFQLSPPKPNIDHNVVISDYTQMDRVFKEERKYILNLVRVIKNLSLIHI